MIRTLLTATGLFLSVSLLAQAPCNLTNSSGCDCLDGSNNCDLLPDLTIAQVLLNDAGSNPESVGELGVSVSSPNIGHGPLRIIATDYFVCGTDTVLEPGGYVGSCPDGSDPRQLIKQRIYHKNPDGSMTFYDRWAGSMTYHISHGHMHVDDWGKYSLRNEVPGVDPIDWPIVAEGAKLGFCLMDYGSCNYYNGHCVDNAGNVLTTNAPNYGLGGGSYSCGLSNQGISAGYTDIYYYYLDGMQIPIPASVCNGTYKLVVVLDPYDYFLEEDETNNVKVATVTLTQQGGGSISIVTDGPTSFCEGNDVTLSIDAPASSYTWSNGATTPSITVSSTASISCTAVTTCGLQTTPTVSINVAPATAPVGADGTTCGPGSVSLNASGAGTLRWYDSPVSSTVLATGASFNTPSLTSSTTYYVEAETGSVGPTSKVGPVNHTGTSFFNGSTVNSHLIFDALTDFTLKSVKVYTDQPGNRLIELRNSSGAVLQSATVNIPVGESRVTLNFSVPTGTNLQLGTNSAYNNSNFGYVSPQLRRTSASMAFPYTIADVTRITNTPYGTSYYYYFYDWEVKEQDEICISSRTPVQAIVDNSPGCTGTLACTTPPSTSVSGISATGATVSWTSGGADVVQYQVEGRKAGTAVFRSTNRTTLSYNVRNLKSSTAYEWRVRSLCSDGNYTPYTALSAFVTPAGRLEDLTPSFSLFPNPSAGHFEVQLQNAHGQGFLTVENLLGQTLWTSQVQT
ncbi:MAG: hypothetical protein GC205_05650, partial [Bacteroidetes bacterium]|nr:hypothetical protein [Bacteroidota bacterium]